MKNKEIHTWKALSIEALIISPFLLHTHVSLFLLSLWPISFGLCDGHFVFKSFAAYN